MFGIDFNNEIVNACKRILKFAPKLQSDARKRLVDELQHICSKCDDAYSAVFQRLLPVKEAYGKPEQLGRQLRAFAADPAIRATFKPDHLCGEIDHLVQELKSYLSTLRYSVNFTGLDTLERGLRQMGNYDAELYHQYDAFAVELDQVATQLEQTTGAERDAWRQYVQDLVDETQRQLSNSVENMRAAKKDLMANAF